MQLRTRQQKALVKPAARVSQLIVPQVRQRRLSHRDSGVDFTAVVCREPVAEVADTGLSAFRNEAVASTACAVSAVSSARRATAGIGGLPLNVDDVLVALSLVTAERRSEAPELVSRLASTNPALASATREARQSGGFALGLHGDSWGRVLQGSVVVDIVASDHAQDALENAESESNGLIAGNTAILVEVNRGEVLIDSGGRRSARSGIAARVGSGITARGKRGGWFRFGVIAGVPSLASSNTFSRPLSEFSAVNEAISVSVEFGEGLQSALTNALFGDLISSGSEVQKGANQRDGHNKDNTDCDVEVFLSEARSLRGEEFLILVRRLSNHDVRSLNGSGHLELLL
jgi:hypothetical protein